MKTKRWKISSNGRELDTVHTNYRTALLAASVLRSMTGKKFKVVRATA